MVTFVNFDLVPDQCFSFFHDCLIYLVWYSLLIALSSGLMYISLEFGNMHQVYLMCLLKLVNSYDPYDVCLYANLKKYVSLWVLNSM